MFLISKYRGESDLGLCSTLVLANRMPQCIGKFQQILWPNTFFNRESPPRSCIFLQVPKLCTDLDPTFLYILILGTYGNPAKTMVETEFFDR